MWKISFSFVQINNKLLQKTNKCLQKQLHLNNIYKYILVFVDIFDYRLSKKNFYFSQFHFYKFEFFEIIWF